MVRVNLFYARFQVSKIEVTFLTCLNKTMAQINFSEKIRKLFTECEHVRKSAKCSPFK